MSDAALMRRPRDRDRLAVAGEHDLRAFASAGRHTSRVRLLRRAIVIFCSVTVGLGGIIIFFDPFSRLAHLSIGGVGLNGSKITIDTPRLTGKRRNGMPYEVRAAQGIQDMLKPDIVELVRLDAKAQMTASSWVNLTANEGTYNSAKDEVQLKGRVRIRSDAGYEVKTDAAMMELKSGLMKTTEAVNVVMKAGSVDADQMQIVDNGEQVVFEGNVHSILLSEEQQTETAGLQKDLRQ
ncbi:MAG: LPS export ABC transporter periplasmic protein LptC [Methylobacteriaceae bacterium]|nr:LPS export ABC transporter periplasmic protein LptC [Methylobacteriaceae bacterium]